MSTTRAATQTTESNTTMTTITIQDAIRQQPKLASEPGYLKWVEDDDFEALDEALAIWGLNATNEDGEIEIDED